MNNKATVIIVSALILIFLAFFNNSSGSKTHNGSFNSSGSKTHNGSFNSRNFGKERLFNSNNFILIDKILDGYRVRFELNNDSGIDLGKLVEIEYEDFNLSCLGSGGTRKFLITSQEEYQNLIDKSPDLHPNPYVPCIGYEFPKIDFSKKTLLGYSTSIGGCDVKIKKRLFRDDENKEYIYFINTTSIGSCE